MILHYPQEVDTPLIPGTFVFLICEDGSEHKGEMNLRKAGLEVRDSIRWFHGSPVKHLTVVVGRKPVEGTVAENVLKYGCGGLNIDAGRVPTDKPIQSHHGSTRQLFEKLNNYVIGSVGQFQNMGRFPANVIHDGGCDDSFPITTSGVIEPHHKLPLHGSGHGTVIYGALKGDYPRARSGGGRYRLRSEILLRSSVPRSLD